MSDTHRVAGLPSRPTLADLAERVGNEEWLAALALLRVVPPVAADAALWTRWDEQSGRYTTDDPELLADLQTRTFHPSAVMDWDGWIADVDAVGRGWSSTERRVFALVAALVVDGRTVPLRGVLDQLGSWEPDVLEVLVQWATGGNNREHPGRLGVTRTTPAGVGEHHGPGHG